jgi:hypothetical protein
MKSIFFWDMTPCSALSGTRRFGGTYRLHLQGRRIVQQSSEQASGNCLLATSIRPYGSHRPSLPLALPLSPPRVPHSCFPFPCSTPPSPRERSMLRPKRLCSWLRFGPHVSNQNSLLYTFRLEYSTDTGSGPGKVLLQYLVNLLYSLLFLYLFFMVIIFKCSLIYLFNLTSLLAHKLYPI